MLDSWLDTRTLEDTKLENVCTKGFDVPVGGITLPTGQVRLKENDFVENKKYEFLLCKVSVGVAFCVTRNTDVEKLTLPPEYDSIYLYDENDDSHQFKHDYVIFKTGQVLHSRTIQFVMIIDFALLCSTI